MSLLSEVKLLLSCRADGVLDLHGRELADGDIVELSRVINTLPVRVLYLWRNNIGDDGAEALARALSRNTTVQEVVLVQNNITVVGCRAFAHELAQNATLVSINLGGNKLTREADDIMTGAGWHVPTGWQWQYHRVMDAAARWEAERVQQEREGRQGVLAEITAREAHARAMGEVARLRAELQDERQRRVDDVSEMMRQARVAEQQHQEDLDDVRAKNANLPQRIERLMEDMAAMRLAVQQTEATVRDLRHEHRQELEALRTEVRQERAAAAEDRTRLSRQLRSAHESVRVLREDVARLHAAAELRTGELRHDVDLFRHEYVAERAMSCEYTAQCFHVVADAVTKMGSAKPSRDDVWVSLPVVDAASPSFGVETPADGNETQAGDHLTNDRGGDEIECVGDVQSTPALALPDPPRFLVTDPGKPVFDHTPSINNVGRYLTDITPLLPDDEDAVGGNPHSGAPRPIITVQQQSEIERVFHEFDTDGSGAIDVHELQVAMRALGHDLSLEDVRALLEEVAAPGAEEIGFTEFEAMMAGIFNDNN
eukprot:PhM_4_TR7363/c0_g1_i1/m.42247